MDWPCPSLWRWNDALLVLRGTKCAKKNIQHTLHHHHYKPEPVIQGRMDSCFHDVYVKPSECHSRNVCPIFYCSVLVQSHLNHLSFFTIMMFSLIMSKMHWVATMRLADKIFALMWSWTGVPNKVARELKLFMTFFWGKSVKHAFHECVV